MLTTISKGLQITIPAEMRERFGLNVGSKLDLIDTNEGILIKPIAEDLETLFKEADKINPKYNFTAEEMDELNDIESTKGRKAADEWLKALKR